MLFAVDYNDKYVGNGYISPLSRAIHSVVENISLEEAELFFDMLIKNMEKEAEK